MQRQNVNQGRTVQSLADLILRLTRWPEHVLFTLPATLLGVGLALERVPAALDWRVGVVSAANVLAVAFAFMANDIEDAPDDARDPARCAHNVIAAGALPPRVGWVAAWGAAAGSLLLFASVNERVLAVGGLTVLLGWLYSWRRVRLKALPLVDVLAHMLMLSALLFLAGYVAYARDVLAVWPVTVGVALVSGYGQLYNQLRDFELDRVAGLHNTASILGPRGTAWAMRACLLVAAACFGGAVVAGIVPAVLVLLIVMLSPLVLVFRTAQDMRGTPAIDASGRLQTGAMAVALLALVIWLLVSR